jgi:hypothetical protein
MDASNAARWLKASTWLLTSRRRGRNGIGHLRSWRCLRCARCRVISGASKSNWRVWPIFQTPESLRRLACLGRCPPAGSGRHFRQSGRRSRRVGGQGYSTLLRRDRRAKLPCVYSAGRAALRVSITLLRPPVTRSLLHPLVVLEPEGFHRCDWAKLQSPKGGFQAFEPACSNTRGLEGDRQACSAHLLATAFALADIRHGPIGSTSVAPSAIGDIARDRLERLPEHERRFRPGTEAFGGKRFRGTEYVC